MALTAFCAAGPQPMPLLPVSRPFASQGGLYRPRTKETREAYEALLAIIHSLFGEQPQVRGRAVEDAVAGQEHVIQHGGEGEFCRVHRSNL